MERSELISLSWFVSFVFVEAELQHTAWCVCLLSVRDAFSRSCFSTPLYITTTWFWYLVQVLLTLIEFVNGQNKHALFKAVLSNQSVFHCLCIDSDGHDHILDGLQLKCSLC